MDRNVSTGSGRSTPSVALRKESVDRNITGLFRALAPSASLSARRAWIEIENVTDIRRAQYVALRKESVDRNAVWADAYIKGMFVALRKESVDRNLRCG